MNTTFVHPAGPPSGLGPVCVRVVIVGAGMAGARAAEELRRIEPSAERLSITLLGAEPEQPYNRIMLSHVVAGGLGDPATSTRLKPEGWWERHGVNLRTGSQVQSIDRVDRRVVLAGGETVEYDHLILATGADATIPPIEGILGQDGELVSGVHRLRDAADCRRLLSALEGDERPVALVGGGFIGLEVACALARSGRAVTVVHPRDWPMDSHLDAGAGKVLTRALGHLGVQMATGARAARWTGSELELNDGRTIECGAVVLSAGTRPRTALAAAAGLNVGHGIIVDDQLGTDDPAISAIGDCAEHRGRVSGLVAPAWDQAAVLAARISGEDPEAVYTGGTEITRLKAFGVDVVALGVLAADPFAADTEVTSIAEPGRGRYARVDVRNGQVLGAVLVGHPEPVGILTQLYEHGLPVPEDVLSVILGRAPLAEAPSPARLPGSTLVCRCNGVTKSALVSAFSGGARDAAALAGATRAGTGCGGCSSVVEGICSWLRESDPDPADTGDLAAPVEQECA